jgi:hypothetical protein
MTDSIGTAAAIYQRGVTDRLSFVRRAEDCAKLTIPSLFPETGHTATSELPTPYQGIGARGVNSLSASLLLALLPPNTPFFRLQADARVFQQTEGLDDIRGEIEASLSMIEQQILAEIERGNYRPALEQALRQLIVTGNCVFRLQPEGGAKVYRLSNFVARRRPDGRMQDLVIREFIDRDELPPELREERVDGHDAEHQTEDLYTWVCWEDDQVRVRKEACGREIEEETFDLADNPYLVLRWHRVDGEDYGRGMIEEYLGELETLEGLQQSVVAASAAASKVLFLVNPDGRTDADEIAEAPNLGVRYGNAMDVGVLQVGKAHDLATAGQVISQITERLSSAFMLAEGSIRRAERVTATEVRMMLEQLERQLGGTYALLSSELQLPMVKMIHARLVREQRVDPLPEGFVEPIIVTGVQALGRNSDNAKLDALVGAAMQTFGPEITMKYLHLDAWFALKGAALGIETRGLVKSKQELAEEEQAARQAAMQAAAGQSLIQAGANAAGQLATQPPAQENPQQ